MVLMKQGSRELRVREDEVQKYINLGYKVINNRGEEIEFKKPLSYDEAIKRIKELEGYNKALKESLDVANRRINELEAKPKKVKKSED